MGGVWRLVSTAAITLIAAGGACFSPRVDGYQCESGVCPPGQACGFDGFCYPEGMEPQPGVDGAIPPADADTRDAAPLNFADTGLLGRYFIDEASSGTDVPALGDATEPATELPLTYDGVTWDTVGGRRALRSTVGALGGVDFNISGSEIDVIDAARQVSVEMVVRVQAVGIDSKLFRFARPAGTRDDFSLSIGTAGEAHLEVNNNYEITWAVDMSQRTVLHLVYDSSVSPAEDRAKLYQDGTLLPPNVIDQVPLNVGLALVANERLIVANHGEMPGGYDGELFYIAFYDAALTPFEVSNNADTLAITDDRQ